MRVIVLTICILSLNLVMFGQIWTTQINYENNEYLNVKPSLLETSDGSILFLYNRVDDPAILINKFTHAISKYTDQGEFVWEKLYSHSEFSGISVGLQSLAFTEMSNEDIVVVGRVKSLNEAYLYHINSEGDSLLYRSYPQYKGFRNCVVYNESNIIVYAEETVTNNHLILKIEINSGNIIQESIVPNHTIKTYINLSPFDNHYFLFTQTVDSINLFRYSTTGILEANNQIELPEGFDSNIASNTLTNLNIARDGFKAYNNATFSVNESLDIDFVTPFNLDNLSVNEFLDKNISEYILPTSDGGCLLSGTFNVPGGNYTDEQIYLIKLDENGEEEWFELYGFWTFASNYIPGIIEVSDGYVFVRHSYITGRIFLTKIRKDGSLEPLSLFNDFSTSTLEVYPNPTIDFINLSGMEQGKFYTIKIYDLKGVHVKSISNFSLNQGRIDVSKFIMGTYILRGVEHDSKEVFLTKFFKK